MTTRTTTDLRTSFSSGGPPRPLLAAAAAALLAACALLSAAPFSLAAHIPGYLLSAPAVFGFVAAFRRTDTGRRRSELYIPSPGWNRVGTVLLVASLVPTWMHAWMIARVVMAP